MYTFILYKINYAYSIKVNFRNERIAVEECNIKNFEKYF